MIEIDKKSLKNGWMIILPFHVAMLILGFFANSTKFERNKYLIGGFFICFAINFLLAIFTTLCSFKIRNNQNQTSVNEYINAFPIGMGIVCVLLAPFTEEYIYRGIIFKH